MGFIFSFLTFLQPGILWPDIAFLRPVLIASVVGLITGLMARSVYKRSEAFRSKPFKWLIVFILAQVASVYYSGGSGMLEEFQYWHVFPLFVAISILLMPTVPKMRRYVWGMMLGGLFIVCYGIYAVPAWGGYHGTGRAGAYGMYDNHNDYSFIIVQIVPYLYMYMRYETGFFKKMILAAGLVACALGIAMSLSRGGMIALVVEGGLIVLLGMEGKKRFVLLPALALVGALAIGYQYMKRAENQSDYTAEDAESGRLELWKAGAFMVLDKPLLGVGSRRFGENSWKYYELSHDMIGKVSHNTYVEVVSSSGLIGFFSFMLMGWHLVKRLKIPCRAGPPILAATCKATLIGIYTVAFRAFLDAKAHDWCFYTFCAVGIVCCLLRDAAQAEQDAAVAQPAPEAPKSPRLARTRA